MHVETVSVGAAVRDDEARLENLLQLYVHDLSAIFPSVVLGDDGRFRYPKLPLYWDEPNARFPFLIRCDGALAGFALVTRGSPASDDPDVFDVAEFFVARGFRRDAVGRRAAALLWSQMPGRWIVRVFERNVEALPFWTRVVTDFSGGAAIERTTSDGWRVFELDSGTRAARR